MSAGGSQAEGDCELNIAPIVDCFTVLIAYLLVSMSFISLGIFEAGLAATGPAPETPPSVSPPPEPPLNLLVNLTAENRLELKLTGGAQHVDQTIEIDAKTDAMDLDTLKTRLEALKQAWPSLKEANISAENSIRYKSIMRVIEAVKTELPKVYLASS